MDFALTTKARAGLIPIHHHELTSSAFRSSILAPRQRVRILQRSALSHLSVSVAGHWPTRLATCSACSAVNRYASTSSQPPRTKFTEFCHLTAEFNFEQRFTLMASLLDPHAEKQGKQQVPKRMYRALQNFLMTLGEPGVLRRRESTVPHLLSATQESSAGTCYTSESQIGTKHVRVFPGQLCE